MRWPWSKKPRPDPKPVATEGLAEAAELYGKDHDVEALEIETEFWVSVEDCERCVGKQLCSYHYERFVYTL